MIGKVSLTEHYVALYCLHMGNEVEFLEENLKQSLACNLICRVYRSLEANDITVFEG